VFSRFAADIVVLVHLAFILFVAAGGLLVLRWPRLAWMHVPAIIWGALIEFAGWICPLTPLENRLRAATGEAAYAGGFIDRYVLPVVYPAGLTRGMQLGLGVAVIAVNLVIYGRLALRIYQRVSRED
jgi:hypothetical protein